MTGVRVACDMRCHREVLDPGGVRARCARRNSCSLPHITRRRSRSTSCSSSRNRRIPGILDASSVIKVSTAQAKKQAAPSDVFQLHAARESIEPVEGTTYPATAETANKVQPSRFTAGCDHPASPRTGSQRHGLLADPGDTRPRDGRAHEGPRLAAVDAIMQARTGTPPECPGLTVSSA